VSSRSIASTSLRSGPAAFGADESAWPFTAAAASGEPWPFVLPLAAGAATEPGVGAGADTPAALGVTGVGDGGAGAGGATSSEPASSTSGASLLATQAENWPMILSATSEMTPRPNWAGRPVMVMSVTIVTAVRFGPSATIVPVTVAFAVPLPRESRPVASMTTLWLASSRVT
jgi:hypothetical protein